MTQPLKTADPARPCPRCGIRPRYVLRNGETYGYCEECKGELTAKWRKENPDKVREHARRSMRKSRANKKTGKRAMFVRKLAEIGKQETT